MLLHKFLNVFIPVTIPENGAGDTPESNNADATAFIDGLNSILTKYKGTILGVFGLATISVVGLLIYYLIQLGGSGSSPQKREHALHSIFCCAVATAILGSFTLVFGLFFHALD